MKKWFDKITVCIIIAINIILTVLPAFSVSASSGGTILISSDDYDYSTGTVSYPRVIHLPGGSSRYPGHISSVPGNIDNITTSNGYYTDSFGNKVFAFCIDSDRPGVGEAPGGQYQVNLTEQLTDTFLTAALRLANRPDVNNILYPGLSFPDMDYWVNYSVKIVVKFYNMTGDSKPLTLTEINNLVQISPPFGSGFIPPGDDNFGNKVIAAVKNAYNWITANENAPHHSGDIEITCLTSNLRELINDIEYSGPYKG